jgi:hypothetical protein
MACMRVVVYIFKIHRKLNFIELGGFKTWECAFDLIKLLDELYSVDQLNGQRVLEVG